jgi:hypothetical protein
MTDTALEREAKYVKGQPTNGKTQKRGNKKKSYHVTKITTKLLDE